MSESTPSAALTTYSLRPALTVECFSTGWQAALLRPPKVKVFTAQLAAPAPGMASMSLREPGSRPRVLSSRSRRPNRNFPRPRSPRPTRGHFRRAAPPTWPPRSHVSSRRGSSRRATRSSSKIGCIICLQPPLETLLGCDSLAFPFRPFPYQFEGVAFLYPRMAAVLADEMGLGKTMQAITAMRMLLHAGEISTRCCWFAPSRW